jgi:hypothetical protein
MRVTQSLRSSSGSWTAHRGVHNTHSSVYSCSWPQDDPKTHGAALFPAQTEQQQLCQTCQPSVQYCIWPQDGPTDTVTRQLINRGCDSAACVQSTSEYAIDLRRATQICGWQLTSSGSAHRINPLCNSERRMPPVAAADQPWLYQACRQPSVYSCSWPQAGPTETWTGSCL